MAKLSSLLLDGANYLAQNGQYSWSLNVDAGGSVRFEVRSGDQWSYDPDSKERSELSGETVHAPATSITVSYSFMIEGGADNTADWMVLGQFHADDLTTSPPFAVEMIGEKMAIAVRYMLPGDDTATKMYAYIDEQDIQRDRYYEITIAVKFDNGDAGHLAVWRDGVEIVDYDGPIGYGTGVYWKYGIYRAESDESLAVDYRDFSLTADQGAIVLGTNASDRFDDTSTPQGQPGLTDHGDQIRAYGGRDVVHAGTGDDLLITGAGRDRVVANAGKDVVITGRGADHLLGGEGDDVLIGGRGRDTFRFSDDFGNDIVCC